MSAPVEVAARPHVAIAVLCVGGLTVAMSQTMVIPLQPMLPTLLGTSPANAAWVITVTLLAGAVAMPIAGKIADLIGKRRVLAFDCVAMAVGSLICALSNSLLPMLVGRALQGVALGFIAVGISMIREITTPEMATTGTAAMSATLGVGGAVGLPASAWVVQVSDWHILFWASALLAAVVGALVLVLVPSAHAGTRGRLDLWGALVMATGLVLVLTAVSKGNSWGWASGATVGSLVGGVVILLLWVFLQLRTAEPLVDLRTSASRPVLLTNLAAAAIGFGMMANGVVVPQLLQLPEVTGYGLGQSLLATGLWMTPGGVVMLLCAPVAGRLIRVNGPRWAIFIGASILVVGYASAPWLMQAPWQLVIGTCLTSAGVGIGYAAMPSLVLDSVPRSEAASAVGLNALMRAVGTTTAAAVMGAILTSNTQVFGGAPLPTQRAFEVCFLVAAAAAACGAALILFVREPRHVQPSHELMEDAAVAAPLVP